MKEDDDGDDNDYYDGYDVHPSECPHHSFSLHPLAVDHEEQQHEEHHEVEDENEHCQPTAPQNSASAEKLRNISSK